MNCCNHAQSADMAERGRIYILDAVRGFCVLLMVFYHGFFTLGFLFNISWVYALFEFFMPAAPVFAGMFIFICGIACRLSRSNLKRGLKLSVVALGVSAVTCTIACLGELSEIAVWFGVLHFLAVSILLFALAGKFLNGIPPLAGSLVSILLFIVFFRIESGTIGIGPLSVSLPGSLYSSFALYPLGMSPLLAAGDYFPLLPWIFVFFAGCFLGVYFKEGRIPALFYQNRFRAFGFIGRHALIIYIVHQPAIYAFAYAAAWLAARLGG